MNDADVRALRRAAILLLAVSTARWAWQARDGGLPPAAGGGADTVAALLAESRVLADDARTRSTPLAPGQRLDPNRAPEEELDRLPGVGAATARALVASRERDGPFRTPADLGRVRGIGPASVERMAPFLEFGALPAGRPGARTADVDGRPSGRAGRGGSILVPSRPPVGRAEAGPGRGAGSRSAAGSPLGSAASRRAPPTPGSGAPVDVNRADEDALQALPGVGPALAARIVAARAEAPFRSVDDLLRVRGIGPATLERLRPRVTTGGRGGG